MCVNGFWWVWVSAVECFRFCVAGGGRIVRWVLPLYIPASVVQSSAYDYTAEVLANAGTGILSELSWSRDPALFRTALLDMVVHKGAGCNNQWNIGSHAPLNPGRRALSITNKARSSQLQHGGIISFVQVEAASAQASDATVDMVVRVSRASESYSPASLHRRWRVRKVHHELDAAYTTSRRVLTASRTEHCRQRVATMAQSRASSNSQPQPA